MNKPEVFCLFERSNTFTNVFRSLGYNCLSYDIADGADVIMDIFKEIKEYKNRDTIFNAMKAGDYVFAFFPCTFFSTQNKINSKTQSPQMENWDNFKRLEYSQIRIYNLYNYYWHFCELISICMELNLKLIIENPYHDNFLNDYFPPVYNAKVILKNRTKLGDNMKKPTMFMFFNCEPKFEMYSEEHNLITKTVRKSYGFERSKITPEFAENFIKNFVI